MVMQGFTPVENQARDIIDFCERLEFLEGLNQELGAKPKTGPKGGSRTDGKSRAKPSEEATKFDPKRPNEPFCELHGVYGHSTGDCKVMLAQAKRMRRAYDSKTPEAKASDYRDKKRAATKLASSNGANFKDKPGFKPNRTPGNYVPNRAQQILMSQRIPKNIPKAASRPRATDSEDDPDNEYLRHDFEHLAFNDFSNLKDTDDDDFFHVNLDDFDNQDPDTPIA